MKILTTLYSKLPLNMQNLAVSLYGFYWKWLRLGGEFQKEENAFKEREIFNDGEWKVWQKNKLSEMLAWAVNEVPYYRQTWNDQQKKDALNGNLERLPLLDKEVVRKMPTSLLRSSIKPLKPIVFHTSGSTGTPIKSFWIPEEVRRTVALREVRSANWAGVSYHQPRATFSGRMVEPNPHSKGPFYRFNTAEKQVYFSAFHLRRDTAALYLVALRKHHVQWITGYAHSIYMLAQYCVQEKLSAPKVKTIITTSEKLTAPMRALIEEVFQCKVFEQYGSVEEVFFANECVYQKLHVSPDAGIIEILRPDGTPCQLGELGEIVATGLIHSYQLFIRYRTGDLGIWDKQTECSCGRKMPILKEVVGRLEDVVRGPDGRELVRFHGIFVDLPNVIEGQIIQEELDSIKLRVVTSNQFGKKEKRIIEKRFYERLGKLKIVIERVDRLEKDKSGKHRAIVSLLKNSALSNHN